MQKPQNQNIVSIKQSVDFTSINAKELSNAKLILNKISIIILLSVSFTMLSHRKTRKNPYKLLIESSKLVWHLSGGAILISSLLKDPIEDLGRLLSPYLPKQLCSNKLIAFEQTTNSYDKIRAKIIDQDRQHLDTTLFSLRTKVNKNSRLTIDDVDLFDVGINYINAVVSIYNIDKNRGFSQQNIPQLIERLETLLITYPTLKDDLKKYLTPIIISDIFGKKHQPQAIFCEGAFGIGKTTLIKSFFKEISFNTVVMSASKLKQQNYNINGSYYYTFNTKNIHPVSRQIYEFSQNPQNSKYTVIILDELDKYMILQPDGSTKLDGEICEALLAITEPNTQYWFDESINVHIDMQYVIIVIISNTKDLINDTAFSRRLLHLHFPAIEPEIKKNIIDERVTKYCCEFNITLTQEQQEYLTNLIQANNKPGVGELIEDTKTFLNNLQNTAEYISLFKGTIWENDSKEILTSFKSQTKYKIFEKPTKDIKPEIANLRPRANSI
jgi:Cdc6-like AAA superfamily ATPase